MLPSTSLTTDDIIAILRARVWQLLVTAAIVSATSAAIAIWLPNRYRSETLILVVPQRIPETYVKSTVTARLEDRLQSITQQILSRTRLERIIDDFHLYAAKRRGGDVMESIVDDMRKDIDVKVVKGNAFRVAYLGDDAKTVMEVTNRLASLFVEENLRDREVLAEDTNAFLGAQVAEARRRLIEHETTLEAYRQQHAGDLPSQLGSNVQALQNVQVRLQSVLESINRDRDRRLLLERQLRDAERDIELARAMPAEGMPAAPVTLGGAAAPALMTPAQRLAAARAELETLRARLQPDHPDFKRMQRIVRELENKAAAETERAAMAEPLSTDAPGSTDASASRGARPITVTRAVSLSPIELERQARLSDLRLQLDQIDRQLAFKLAEEQQLRGAAADYQRRIDRVPARESELAELTRDYSTLQTLYQTLLAKQEESKIAADLEHRQIGDRFKLLDPARLAERPFSPRRWLIDLAGLAGGLLLGIVLITIAEFRDRTFRNETDVFRELAVPVLAVVPLMESSHQQQRTARRRMLLALAKGSLVAACIPVVIYSLLH